MESNDKISHDEIMRIMAAFESVKDEPNVGIFRFNPNTEELFDVHSIGISALNGNMVTINKLHKDVWAKNYFRAKNRNLTDSIYFTDYTQIPRGQVVYDRQNDRFIVKVGEWARNFQEILTPLIQFEFNLSDFDYDYDSHWNTGSGWPEQDFLEYSK